MRIAQYVLLWAALACVVVAFWIPVDDLWRLFGTGIALIIGALVCSIARTEKPGRGSR